MWGITVCITLRVWQSRDSTSARTSSGRGGGEASLREIVEIYNLRSFIHVSRLYLYLGTTERLLFFLRVL